MRPLRRLVVLCLAACVVLLACRRDRAAAAWSDLPAETDLVATLDWDAVPGDLAPALLASLARVVHGGAIPAELAPRGIGRVTLLRWAPPAGDADCDEAVAHVTELMRAQAQGAEPRAEDVAGVTRACRALGGGACLRRARDMPSALACMQRARLATGARWGLRVQVAGGAHEVARGWAVRLGLRVQAGFPAFADDRVAVDARGDDELWLGPPALLARVGGGEGAQAPRLADTELGRLLADMRGDGVIAYRIEGAPGARAAALTVELGADTRVAWRVQGDPTGVREARAALEQVAAAWRADRQAAEAAVGEALGVGAEASGELVGVALDLLGGVRWEDEAGGAVARARSARAPGDWLRAASRTRP